MIKGPRVSQTLPEHMRETSFVGLLTDVVCADKGQKK